MLVVCCACLFAVCWLVVVVFCLRLYALFAKICLVLFTVRWVLFVGCVLFVALRYHLLCVVLVVFAG